MDSEAINAEVLAAGQPFGAGTRRLRIGEGALHFEGLDAELVRMLERRFGPFIESGEHAANDDYRLEVVRCRRRNWLEQQRPGELYRFEALGPPATRVVLSYHFAMCRVPHADDGETRWRVAIAEDPAEPVGRILDNAARFLTALSAIRRGGFAMHGAGVLRDGRAHVFAGPSRSGKSSAVRLSEACSLGDDFAVVVPRDGRWFVPALPFDNAERIEVDPPRELSPLAGIWRLFQADRHAVERPAGISAITSLMGCVAFPWVVPECADLLLSRATRVVDDGRFGHLHFRLDPGFWSLLV